MLEATPATGDDGFVAVRSGDGGFVAVRSGDDGFAALQKQDRGADRLPPCGHVTPTTCCCLHLAVFAFDGAILWAAAWLLARAGLLTRLALLSAVAGAALAWLAIDG